MPVFDTDILDLIRAGDKSGATDALNSAHPDGFVEVIGAVVEEVRLIPEATSGSSNAIGSGLKLFALDSPKGWKAGLPVFIRDTADPTVNWMAGRLTVDESALGEITVEVDLLGGSGTYTAWLISAILSVATVVSPPVAVADGGTGATTASGARTSLGVALTKRVVAAQSTEAVSADVGDTYLILPTGDGAWAGHDDEFATWNGSTWDFEPPVAGAFASEIINGRIFVYNVISGWSLVASQAMGLVSVKTTLTATTTLPSEELFFDRWALYQVDSASPVTITLPAAVSIGTVVLVTNKGAGTVTVNVASGGTINGASSVALSQWQTARLANVALVSWVQW
jgi:hypothetical protein